ncbi:FmdE family protein, partial [Halodesulfovibrio aestuarii]
MSQACDLQPAFKNIGDHTFEEFIEMATLFHNYPAPGLLIGGYMVEEARKHMPEGTLYEAISETTWCLPDAIQMLTPCTIGNGWMNVLNLGRYAMSLYDKHTGEGVRVWLDIHKIPKDSEILVWLMKEKPKQEQDSEKLRREIGGYGADILSTTPITIPKPKLIKRSKGKVTPCSSCGEPYPSAHGALCRACQGESPYAGHTTLSMPSNIVFPVPEELKTVPANTALGKNAVHDMTSILPGTSKGAAFKRGDTFGAGDLCRLQQMGKNNVYVTDAEVGNDWVHEDDCANAFATAMCGTGVSTKGEPHEGKVTLIAELDG